MMIFGGIVCFVFAIVYIIAGCCAKDENVNIKIMCGFFGGIFAMFGFMFLMPPFKERTDEDFKVVTKEVPGIQKEIHIDTENNADTTYYYIFKDSSVKPNK